ncbi:MAG: phospholipase D-like domain-containing protein [Cyanobacteria bacterium J06626_6]
MTYRPPRRWLIFCALGLCLTAGSSLWRLTREHRRSQVRPLVEALPQDPHLQVFFNQSEASVYTDPYRQMDRHGDDLEQVIVTAIDQSEISVDIAVQALNLPAIAQAIAGSARRGVQVRLILENQYAQPEAEQAEALQILNGSNIAKLDDTADGSKGSGLMHHKFLVVDQQLVITGSANFTLSGIHGDRDAPESRGNANMLLKIDSPTVARAFTEEFNLMWGDGPGGAPDSEFGLQKAYRAPQTLSLPTGTLTLQFSPVSASKPWEQSVNGLIARTLSQATQSVDMALFVFSDQKIANQLETQVKAGTALRALIDPGFIYRSYSEALDMLGIVLPNQHCKVEDNNQPWTSPIHSVGSPQLPAGDKLHHKFAIVDQQTVIVGSQNWSHAANTQNDETLMVIQNPTVAAHFNREFERLYRAPLLGHTPAIQRKTAAEKQRCIY